MINKFLYILILLFIIVGINTGCGDDSCPCDGNGRCKSCNQVIGPCKPSRKYLVVTPFAGLANRLRVLASAKIMAGLTDRHLVVDWSIIPNELPAHWHELFLNPLTMIDQSPLLADGCSFEEIINAGQDNPIIKNLGNQNRSQDQERLKRITEDKEPIVYFGTSLNFWPDEKYLTYPEYKTRYRIFYQSLDPHRWVSEEIKRFQKDNNFDKKFMIGVHYRTWSTGKPDETQGVTTDKESRYLNDFVIAMKDAVDTPLANTDGKPVAFFLATDDPKVKEKMLLIPELAGKIFTRDVTIDRSTVLGQQSALVDWFLLGEQTNYIIGTYQSSFSDEAAHLTKQDRKVNVGETAYKSTP